MVDVVDSIVAQLEVRLGNYVTNFNRAADAHERFTKTRPDKVGQFTTAEVEKYANRHKTAGDVQIQTNDKVARSANKRSAEEVSAADAVKKATRDSEAAQKQAARAAEAAVKASARARVQTEKQAAREIEQAQRRYYAQGPKVFEAKAREFSAVDRQKEIAAAQASAAAMAKAEREKQAAAKITAREEAAAAKVAQARAVTEREASAAIVAAVERETAARVRLAAVAERAALRRSGQIAPAVGSSIGATVPREATGQRGIPASVMAGGVAADVAAEKEVNRLLADQATLSSRLGILKGREKQLVADQVAELRLIGALERAGLEQSEIALRLDERRALIARQRGIEERKQGARSASQFARGAGIGGIGSGGTAVVAGIALAAGIGISAAVIQSAADYAKELKNVSEQIGLTAQQTQVYEAEARRLGVSQNELRNGLGQFADYLGRAKSGGEDQIKTFQALGISVKEFATAGDALPTIIARISSIPDAAQRAAVETRLFGEEGRKLDALLSGGNERINDLAQAMLKAGTILSAADIARLGQISKELDRVKAQLQVSYASVVADNADAIITLANSFGKLVNDIRDAIGWIQAFNSQKLNDLTGGKTLAPPQVASVQTFAEGLVRRAGSFVGGQLGSATPQRDMVNGETRAFLDRIKGASVQPGAVDTALLNRLNAPKPSAGPKGKSAETIANEADQRTRRFNDEIARYQDERLAALADQNSDENERRQAQRDQIDRESATAAADIKLQAQQDIRKGADAALTNARRDQLIAAERAASDEKIQVINLADTLSTLQRRAAAKVDVANFADDILRAQRDLATTTEQRRDIDKRLLENATKRETVAANLVLRRAQEGDPGITRQDIESANRTLSTQPGRVAAQSKQIDRANESPLDTYRRELREATDDTNAAFQSIEVNALNRLEDQISSSIGKVLGLKGAFGELFGSVLADIARLELKKGILALLNQGGAGGEAGGSGSSFASVARSVGAALGIGGARAGGGHVVGGTSYLVGERGPEVVNFPSSGKVYPNGVLPSIPGGASGGGNTVHQHFTLDNRYGITTPELIDEMNAIAKREGTKAAGGSFVASQRSTPGTLAQYDKLEG